jgi:aspartyl-tRNA(Asn)/glutamyl-tRNA(Gln) amidotransferase subunit C
VAVERADLLRIAALARLRLTPEEVERLTEQLNGILEHVERLMAMDVDPDSVPPLALPPAPAGRADVPDADPLARPLAELAPGWREGYFTTPRVLAP